MGNQLEEADGRSSADVTSRRELAQTYCARPTRQRRSYTLTQVFADGALSVSAMVTNPESGGASYFLN